MIKFLFCFQWWHWGEEAWNKNNPCQTLWKLPPYSASKSNLFLSAVQYYVLSDWLHSGSWERSFLSLQGLGKQDFFLIKLIDSQLLLFMVGQMGSSILYFSPFSGLVSTTQERWPSCLMLREPNMFLKFLYFFQLKQTPFFSLSFILDHSTSIL